MATYAVGDIQGCFTTFTHLLELIGFSPSRDRLWLVGDLINRGPDSLSMLRWAKLHDASLHVVLGNHDLHALAVAAGHVDARHQDTLQALLAASDSTELLDWLRNRPMAHGEGEYLMVHAGVLPAWSAQQVLELAAEVEAALRGKEHQRFFSRMYGNLPAKWDDELRGMRRLRIITNALTRLRVCTVDGKMDFRFKGELPDVPAGLMPWFDVPGRKSKKSTLIFGHWSALGLLLRSKVIGLDSGCLWGRSLTALRLEDRRVFQVPSAAADAVARQSPA